MKYFRLLALFVVLTSTVSAQDILTNSQETAITKLLSSQFPANGSGATAIIAKDGKIIYNKAFGLANIELNVPMTPEMVFRIGSITKQFTAIAILQLYEQKKLDLQDELTKYIPDYPVHGNKITIEHLLTHTSGIKSYTSMPDFGNIMHKDHTPLQLISVFKDQPMSFKPGEKFEYNNSGYVLLGYIIERVSGQSYAAYMDDKIFKPLGMLNSYYGDNAQLVKNRVSGYSLGDSGIINAPPLSMTIPYAAGSLLSTVENLLKWNTALFNYKLVSEETMDRATTAYTLTSGTKTAYGYGLGIGSLQGEELISHGGGINGFQTYGLYLPSHKVYVAVLSNSNANPPDLTAQKMGAIMIGKPIEDAPASPPKEIQVNENILGKYIGEYQLAPTFSIVISRDGKQLFAQATGQVKFELFGETDKLFFVKTFPAKIEFITEASGVATKLILHQNGQKHEAKKIK